MSPRWIRRNAGLGSRSFGCTHMARLANSAAISLVTSTSWQRKVRDTPRNVVCGMFTFQQRRFLVKSVDVPELRRSVGTVCWLQNLPRVALRGWKHVWWDKSSSCRMLFCLAPGQKQSTTKLIIAMRNILELLTSCHLHFTYFQSGEPGGFLGTTLAVVMSAELPLPPSLQIPLQPSRAPCQPTRTMHPIIPTSTFRHLQLVCPAAWWHSSDTSILLMKEPHI